MHLLLARLGVFPVELVACVLRRGPLSQCLDGNGAPLVSTGLVCIGLCVT